MADPSIIDARPNPLRYTANEGANPVSDRQRLHEIIDRFPASQVSVLLTLLETGEWTCHREAKWLLRLDS